MRYNCIKEELKASDFLPIFFAAKSNSKVGPQKQKNEKQLLVLIRKKRRDFKFLDRWPIFFMAVS